MRDSLCCRRYIIYVNFSPVFYAVFFWVRNALICPVYLVTTHTSQLRVSLIWVRLAVGCSVDTISNGTCAPYIFESTIWIIALFSHCERVSLTVAFCWILTICIQICWSSGVFEGSKNSIKWDPSVIPNNSRSFLRLSCVVIILVIWVLEKSVELERLRILDGLSVSTSCRNSVHQDIPLNNHFWCGINNRGSRGRGMRPLDVHTLKCVPVVGREWSIHFLNKNLFKL